MSWYNFVEEKLGFKIVPAIASFFGGLVSIYLMPTGYKKTFVHIMANLIAGMVTTGYTTGLLLHIFNLNASFAASIGFCMGLFGLVIADKFIDFLVESKFQEIISALPFVERIFNIFKNKKK